MLRNPEAVWDFSADRRATASTASHRAVVFGARGKVRCEGFSKWKTQRCGNCTNRSRPNGCEAAQNVIIDPSVQLEIFVVQRWRVIYY